MRTKGREQGRFVALSGFPPIRVSRVYEACCNHQVVSRADNRLVKLPIQHELTFALIGWGSRCA